MRLWLRAHAVSWARPDLYGGAKRDHDPLRSAADSAVYYVSLAWLARQLSAAVGAALVRWRRVQYLLPGPSGVPLVAGQVHAGAWPGAISRPHVHAVALLDGGVDYSYHSHAGAVP